MAIDPKYLDLNTYVKYLTTKFWRKQNIKENLANHWFQSSQFSHLVVSDSLWPHGLQNSQSSLSVINSWSLLKFMFIELVMPSGSEILETINKAWSILFFFFDVDLNWASQGAHWLRNSPANTGDMGLIPGLGRSPGGGNCYQLHYSCLGNPMDRGAWQLQFMGLENSQTWLSD